MNILLTAALVACLAAKISVNPTETPRPIARPIFTSVTPRQIPTDAGESREDRNITGRIAAEIQHTDALSPEAHQVGIRTVNRLVTLTGIVANRVEKRFVEGAAARYAIGGQVSSQLEIKSVPTAAAN